MSVLVFDAARILPRAAAQPLPSEAARVKAIVKRGVALTAISLVLCSVPSDGGPAQTRSVAAPQMQTPFLNILKDMDR